MNPPTIMKLPWAYVTAAGVISGMIMITITVRIIMPPAKLIIMDIITTRFIIHGLFIPEDKYIMHRLLIHRHVW